MRCIFIIPARGGFKGAAKVRTWRWPEECRLVGWAARTSRLALAKGRLAGRVILLDGTARRSRPCERVGCGSAVPAAGRTRH